MQVISLQGSSSSKTPEVKISRSRNYNGWDDDLISKQIKGNPQFLDDDDQQLDITLNLFWENKQAKNHAVLLNICYF